MRFRPFNLNPASCIGMQAALFCMWAFFISSPAHSSPNDTQALQRFEKVSLIQSPANDGDSFLVNAGGRRIHLRLYFVDSPESRIRHEEDARRLEEQAMYFGLRETEDALRYGREASRYVKKVLAKPFIIYTDFADGLGRSKSGRVYGFVTTSRGEDLAALLVANGLARTHGRGRETPDGRSRTQNFRSLHALQNAAIANRRGLWSKSDPTKISDFLRRKRKGNRSRQNIHDLGQDRRGSSVIDINTASKTVLETLKGIGPVLAQRIIAGRPYRKVDDLIAVKGIGPEKIRRLRPHVAVRNE